MLTYLLHHITNAQKKSLNASAEKVLMRSKVKPLDEGHVLEHEFKFFPFGPSDEDSLSIFRPVLRNGMFIELYDTVAVLHLYLDTSDRFLLTSGCSLRIQTRQQKKKCKVVFKSKRANKGLAMIRPETWTSYRSREVIDDLKTVNPVGRAFKTLRAFCDEVERQEAEFEGVAWVQSFRRIYVVWSGGIVSKAPLPFSAIVLEDVCGNELVDVNLDEIVPSFRYKMIAPIRQVRYRLGEIEAIGQHMEHAESTREFLEALEMAAASHPDSNFDIKSKYERVMYELGNI